MDTLCDVNSGISQTPESVRHFAVLLSPTRRGARLARRLTAAQFAAWGCQLGAVETAEQVAAELASNAALHGRVRGRGFRLRLLLSGGGRTLRIEVVDARGEVGLPPAERPFAHSTSGRGLFLVEALAQRWGVEHGPVPCKTVWAEVEDRIEVSATRSTVPR